MTLHRLPRQLPPAAVLLADLDHPTAADIAGALGCSVRSVWRWQSADAWPRPEHLALFFASRYGWSLVDSEARYSVQLARGLADALRAESATLRRQLAQLEQLADTGASNAAVLLPGRAVTARRPLPVEPLPQRGGHAHEPRRHDSASDHKQGFARDC